MYIEIFLPIKGYEGLYEVSALGHVRNAKTKRVLKGRPVKNGYLLVALYKNGIAKEHSIHRLVAERFLINPLNKPEVNHKNGIKTDNRVSELEWSTHSENVQHAFRNDLHENTRKAAAITFSNLGKKWGPINIKKAWQAAAKLPRTEKQLQSSRETIKKAIKAHAKARSKHVIQYTLDGEFVAEYTSTCEASRQTGIHSISACCRGERNHAGGYIWKYL